MRADEEEFSYMASEISIMDIRVNAWTLIQSWTWSVGTVGYGNAAPLAW